MDAKRLRIGSRSLVAAGGFHFDVSVAPCADTKHSPLSASNRQDVDCDTKPHSEFFHMHHIGRERLKGFN